MIEDVRSGSRLHGNAMLYIHRYQGTGLLTLTLCGAP